MTSANVTPNHWIILQEFVYDDITALCPLMVLHHVEFVFTTLTKFAFRIYTGPALTGLAVHSMAFQPSCTHFACVTAFLIVTCVTKCHVGMLTDMFAI